MHTLSITLFDWAFDGDFYKARRRGTQSFYIGDKLSIIRTKLARLYGDVETTARSSASYAYRDQAIIEQADIVQPVPVVNACNINYISISKPVYYCASRRLGYSRKETVWQVTERNAEPAVVQQAKYENCKQMVTFSVVISRLFNAVRSGVAGAVALGSAYAMSMPQKANADIIYQTEIYSQEEIVADGNYFEYCTVYYNSPQINFRDQEGNLIDGGLTNKVVLLYILDYNPGAGIADYPA